LKNYIENVAKTHSDNSFHTRISLVDRYIASWFFAKMEQQGREVCSFELKIALETLSDDGVANDWEGIGLPLNILCCQGDSERIDCLVTESLGARAVALLG